MVLDRLGPNALSGKDVNDRSEGVSMIGLCVTDVGGLGLLF